MALVTVTADQMKQGHWYCVIAGDEMEGLVIKHNGHGGTEKSVGGYIQDIHERKLKNGWQFIPNAPEKAKEEIIIQEYIPYKKLKILGRVSGQTRFYAYKHESIHEKIDADNKLFWG